MNEENIKVYDGDRLIGIGGKNLCFDQHISRTPIFNISGELVEIVHGNEYVNGNFGRLILPNSKHLPFDKYYKIIFNSDDIVFVFEDCIITNTSYNVYQSNNETILDNVNFQCAKLTTYTRERYEAMNENTKDCCEGERLNTSGSCDSWKCQPGKMDMKDKAIRMLVEAFEKKLESVESVACRKGTQTLISKRQELLRAFESYIKELLVC